MVNLIDYPGASEILEFSEGKVLLVTIKPKIGGVMMGKTIKQLNEYLSTIEAGVVALFRDDMAVPLEDEYIIAKGDKILFIASPQAIQQVLIALGRYTHPNRRIIIAGGGHIGTKLAETLENKYRIKIIDHYLPKANQLAAQLHKSTVLQGDIADRDLLINENIEFTDVFCAVTNDDEANIMSCLQAKRLGARHAMALVNRNAYVDLIDESAIDHAISPQRIMIGSILTKLRRGNMVKVHRIHDEAEAIEVIVHGNEVSSQVIGRKIDEIEIPPSCIIAAVVRGDKVYIHPLDLVLAPDDHVILLLLKKRYLRQVESLFQVSLSYNEI